MNRSIPVFLLLAAVPLFAKDAPSTQADTQPQTQAARPSSMPATTQATAQATGSSTRAASEFPTPGELIRRMKEMKEKQAALPKVAYFDLSRPIVEKPADFSFFGEDNQTTLRSLIARLRAASADRDIRAVLLNVGESGLNLAQAQEVRDTLAQIRKAGKKVFVYADGYDTTGYTIATGATNICMLQGGEIMIPGVGMEATFAKGLLDKIGVQADYVQIGEYKGADEQFTRSQPSEELRGELNKLTDALYEQIVDGISINRNLSRETVKGMIDETILTAQAARDRGFVDHLLDMDGLRALLKQEIGGDVDLVYSYGQPKREEVDISNPWGLLALLARRPEPPSKPSVAIIYADGVIVDGEGGEGLLAGGNVGSHTLRRAFRTAAQQDNVKAVAIRIDSPGGSALASEVMWQAARHVAEKKPVVVSIGGMAASGGYYLASAGDHIFADPCAIIGSIGVVGGKFVTRGLYDKIGLTTESFQRGRNADLFSSSQPFSDRQRRMVTNWMKQTYEQFTERVMHTRTGKIKDIDQVARGRIFVAKQAKDLGMVDEIGGVEDAVAYAARQAGMKPSEYDVSVLPRPRTLADLFNGGGSADMQARTPFNPKVQIGGDSIFGAVSPVLQKVLRQELQMLQLLADRPVILVSPYRFTIR